MRAQRFGPPVMSWQALQQPLRQRCLRWHWQRRLRSGQAVGRQPVPGGWTFQDQYSPIGQEALKMHDYLLMPVITVIVLLVLFLLIAVMAKFNRRANPVASRPATTP
jgi:hypothetical protein